MVDVIGVDVPGTPQRESRFTTPTTTCPYPERWSSTDGDSTEVEVSDLAWGLVRALQPTFCVETGAGWGQTTRRIGEALRANGHGRLTAIEPDHRRVMATREAVRGLPVEVVETSSLGWVPSEPIGFAWLDSLYELRVAEFLAVHRWLQVGAFVCFHDTAPEHGSHRIESGRDLRSEITVELAGLVSLVHLPTPRGVTIAEVLP